MEKERIEFRYYEIPQSLPLIALLGKRWEIRYGSDSMHFHNYMEIGYCYYGDGTMYLGKEAALYGNGTITFIPEHFPHHTKSHTDGIEKWEYLFVDTERLLHMAYGKRAGMAERILNRLHAGMFLIRGGDAPELEMLVRFVLDEMRGRKEFYQESVQAALLSLLLGAVRLQPQGEAAEGSVQEKGRERPVDEGRLDDIMRVLAYIKEHYAQEIKTDQLAQIAHMSGTHFRRKFSEYMHTAPGEYVNLVRLEKACEMLAAGDEKIESIAVKTGFQTADSFIRNFKKMTGEVPREWRKKAREKEEHPAHYQISVLKGW